MKNQSNIPPSQAATKAPRRIPALHLTRQPMCRDEGYLAPCPYCSGLVLFSDLVLEDPDGDVEVGADRCGTCGRHLHLAVGLGSLHVHVREEPPPGETWKWSDMCKHCERRRFQHAVAICASTDACVTSTFERVE